MRALKATSARCGVLASGYLNRDNVLLAARMLAAVGGRTAPSTASPSSNPRACARFMDLTGFDDGDAITIDGRIHKSFQGLDLGREVVVVTSTKGVEGIMREFDRGYSEVTFCKVAVELKADEAVIHKEFHLSSADPEIVGAGNTVVVGNTNYDVADQLADVGMEAIHPKAAKPMELAGISIRLKNTFEPDHAGTLITKDYVGKQARIEVIAGTPKVTIVEIHDPSMVGTVGFDLGVMEIFRRVRRLLHLKCTNANSITRSSGTRRQASLLGAQGEVSRSPWCPPPSCVIGTNGHPGVLARTQILADAGVSVTACPSPTAR
jgi:aspartate kinase